MGCETVYYVAGNKQNPVIRGALFTPHLLVYNRRRRAQYTNLSLSLDLTFRNCKGQA